MNYVTAQILGMIASLYSKWILYGDKLPDGSLLRSFVIVVLASVQLFVTVMVARAIIYFHLLTSGDVEENPGPGHTECMLIVTIF